ncbi:MULTISPECIES: DUF6774 domain-containing protein [Blautia]
MYSGLCSFSKLHRGQIRDLGCGFSQLGDTLNTILVHKEICGGDKIKKTD